MRVAFASSDVDGLMQEALEKVTGQIRTADRVVFLLQEGRQLAIKAAHGGRPGKEVPAERVSRSILRRVRRTGRTLFLTDALTDNGLGPRQSIQEIGQRSVICAPLKANGRVVGLVYADTVSLIAAFTPAHLKWMNTLTDSLNEQLGPLIPRGMETMIDEHTMAPGDDPDSELVLPLQPKNTVSAAPVRNFKSDPSDMLLAPDKTPLAAPLSPAQKAAARAKMRRKDPMKIMDLATFYRGLASMLSAGITVHRALDVLGDQGSTISPVARSLHDDVVNGHRLSVAMARFPHVFSAVQRSLIRVGEETGSLDILANSLAEHVEERIKLRGKVISALTYPAIVGLICFMGCMLAPPLFLNDFFESLKSTEVRLPWLTVTVIGISNALWSPWLWLALAAAAALVHRAWRLLDSKPDWKKELEMRVLRIPIIGPVHQAFFLLGFVQTLALQLEAGLRLDKSLLLSASVSGNSFLQERTRWIVDNLKTGADLSHSMHRSKIFPRTVVEFVALGEETGKMGQSLRFSELYLKERAESALETAETLMEPLAICLVGVLVGIVALACMLPLVRMFEAFV